ncbi:hypothetical protein HHL16_10725 [Pseudoflavitalea sp. G-6-1-2]|uniref:HYC_CC_PP family protein n=1 Tax=Pseudoflavitalea sp. G-6-1-2 TaxID=2728841 RepID=UPI00146D3C10|nr:hypothetical protein [Pseudoflavitalea sp. G-6-1-2]NML21350.1 hypothetical protein [Pseudoflavitalea sp. G-6-1-2]
MKKFLVFILSLLYLGSSAGATVRLHYCQGKLVDIQLGDGNKEKCSGCASKKAKGCKMACCKDEHKMVKLEKDHQKTAEASFQFLQSIAYVTPASFIELPLLYLTALAEEHPISHAPPGTDKVQLHLLNCNFRI